MRKSDKILVLTKKETGEELSFCFLIKENKIGRTLVDVSNSFSEELAERVIDTGESLMLYTKEIEILAIANCEYHNQSDVDQLLMTLVLKN